MAIENHNPQPGTIFVRHVPVRRILLTRSHPFTPGSFANLARNLTQQNYWLQPQLWNRRSIKPAVRWELLIAEAPGTPTTVPNVIGDTTANGVVAITALGFLVTVIYQISPANPPNTIINQTPAGGAHVPITTPVTLTSVAYLTAPNVIGLTQSQASTALVLAGFAPTFTSSYTSTPLGLVDAQSISAGNIVNQLTSPYPITVDISLGPSPFVLLQIAVQAVIEAQLNVQIQYQPSATVPAGYIISQSPAGGTVVPIQGTVVTLVCANGPPSPYATVMMPSVVGLFANTAVEALAALGISVDKYQWVISNAAEGTVTTQSVGAGTQVLPGTIVVLTLSQGTASITATTVVPTV